VVGFIDRMLSRLPTGWVLKLAPWVDSRTLRTLDLNLIYFAVPDLHGRADIAGTIIDLLESCRSEKVVFLGDLIDRHDQSRSVVDQVLASISRNRTWKLIAGNHERMFVENFMADSPALESDTMYNQLDPLEREHYSFIFARLPTYHKVQNLIFVHGGISASWQAKSIAQVPTQELLWTYSIPPRYKGKKLVRGHQKVSAPAEFANQICLETEGWKTGVFHVGIVADIKADRNLIGWLELHLT